MPEGHTLHRIARLHRDALGGKRLSADSPQGRFAAGAARIDGRVLTDVEAHGKLLFHRFDGLREALHVHLGLIGVFRTYRGGAGSEPTAGTRLRLRADAVAVHLSGPMACRLVDADEEDRLRARLGPDPLHRDADPAVFAAALARRRIPIGAALLDQAVVAGIGNVYRAELLFLCGIHPERPARELDENDVAALWRTMRRELRAGERSGRIVTVDPAEVGVASRAKVPQATRVYVYRRGGESCRRCGATLHAWRLAGRTITACPICQPA